MFGLWLFPRLATSATLYSADLTPWARRTWQRSIRALGGCWTGSFTVESGQMTRHKMWEFYHNNIGRRVVENTFGMTSWEGEITEMTITIDGVSYMTSLDPERWHNKVKVQYTYPRFEDVQQGVLAYDPAGPPATFQDTLQDWSDWETAAPGTAVYYCLVTNDDDTTVGFYCGDAAAIANPNDAIEAYLDVALTTRGWQGETAAKTPISYIVSHVERAGAAEATAWAETTDASDLYGESCYIDARGEMSQAVAEAIRDRRLAENAYPKSVPIGGLSTDSSRRLREARLEVICTGYAYSMNRRYMEEDVEPDDISNQVALLVDGSADAAEYVTAGKIDTNATLRPTLTGGNIPFRLWDQAEELAEMGDASANRWIIGVYDSRLLNYQAAETEVTHYWRNGRLTNAAGHPVFPTLIQPNIVVRVDDVLFGVTGGGTNAWQNMRQFYVEEVEFIAPRSYRLTPYEGEALYGTY